MSLLVLFSVLIKSQIILLVYWQPTCWHSIPLVWFYFVFSNFLIICAALILCILQYFSFLSARKKEIWQPSRIFLCEQWGKKINLIFLQYLPLLSLNYPCHLLKALHWPLVPPVLEKHLNLLLQSSFCLPHTSFSFPYFPLTLSFHLAASVFALHILSDTFHYMEMLSKVLFYSSWVSPARHRKSLILR